MAFSEGVTNKRLLGKLETHNIETVVELFALADKCTWEAEAQSHNERRGAPEESASPARGICKKNKWKAVAALAAEGRDKPPTRKAPRGGPLRAGGGFQKLTPVKSGPAGGARSIKLTSITSRSVGWLRVSPKTTRKSRASAIPTATTVTLLEMQALTSRSCDRPSPPPLGERAAPPSRRRAKLLWREICAASPASTSS